jgi:hypothetical protein
MNENILLTGATTGTSETTRWNGGPGQFCVSGVFDGADVLLLMESAGSWIEVCRVDRAKVESFSAPSGCLLRAAILQPGTSTSVTVSLE